MDTPSSKSVYLRAYIDSTDSEEFFSFAINVPQADDVFEIRRGQRGSIPVLTPIKAASLPKFAGFAAVGKTVYRIGGKQQRRHDHHRIRNVASVFSLDNTQGSWKRLAPMRIARSEPQTVAVDGKIYVIGGADYDADPVTQWDELFDTESGKRDEVFDKWGEVFDIESGKWASLSPPSQLPKAYYLFAIALPEDKKFVLGSGVDKFLYFYEVEEGRWRLLEHKMKLNGQPVGVGSYLISLDNTSTLYAYDWIEERSYMGFIKDLDKALPLKHLMQSYNHRDHPALIHLSGNLFCLYCVDDMYVGQRMSLLHCVTFHISLPPNDPNGMLNAGVKSSQVFVIPTPASICGATVTTDEGYSPTASSPVPGMSMDLSSQPNSSSVYVRLVSKEDKLRWYEFSVFSRAADGEGIKQGLKGFGDFKGLGDYLLEPTPLKGKKISKFSACVAVGSTMYCIGGRKPSSGGRLVVHDSVFCLDTSRPKHEQFWVQAPSMLCPRCEPDAFVLNGKIFVMGGTAKACREPWAEVFDPESSSWNPLPPPPSQNPPSDFVLFSAALNDSDLVSVGSLGDDYIYYTYNVHAKKWDARHRPLQNGPCPVRPFSVGSTLFWFDNFEIHAYDTIRELHCSGPIKGLHEIIVGIVQNSYFKPVLLHLGGEQFCLIYCHEERLHDLTLLHCAQIRLSISTGARLTAFAESCQSYLVDSPSALLDAVLI